MFDYSVVELAIRVSITFIIVLFVLMLIKYTVKKIKQLKEYCNDTFPVGTFIVCLDEEQYNKTIELLVVVGFTIKEKEVIPEMYCILIKDSCKSNIMVTLKVK